MMRELSPVASTYEIRRLFESCDKNGNMKIEIDQFEDMFITNDFRLDTVFDREVDQVVAIIKAKNVQLQNFFAEFDKNHTKALDFN